MAKNVAKLVEVDLPTRSRISVNEANPSTWGMTDMRKSRSSVSSGSGGRLGREGIESFNCKFRDECLNEQWLETPQQVRVAIALWRQDYNEVRPHRSCRVCRPRSSPNCIASVLAMQFGRHQRPTRPTNLATPDFLLMNGTARGGRSNRPSPVVPRQLQRLSPVALRTWLQDCCAQLYTPCSRRIRNS
ncbi:transposase [Variovorax paradoxus]|nr:transposase [Variovorax paradoxus]